MQDEPRAYQLLTPRLSLMMLLQYAVWGAWLPVIGRYLGTHLGFSGGEIAAIVGTAGAVGAVFAPFIAGQLADRYFAAERVLAGLMVLGGVIQFVLSHQTGFTAWLVLSILYSLVYMPTIPISNSLAFSHLRDPARQFPPIRLWGTIGWIAVSWIFPMVWLQINLDWRWMPPFLVGDERADVVPRLADALRLSGMLSIVYGIFCLGLPHTPPRPTPEIAFAKAFRLLARPGMAVLTLAALPVAIVHTIYFIQTSQFLPTLEGMRDADTGPAMTIGQFSEILILGGLGYMLRSLGFRGVLIIGGCAYVLRYLIFSMGAPTSLVVASQALHGVCFACFYAAAFVYVERIAPADVRHSAQTVFGIILLGLGPVFSGPVLQFILQQSTRETTIGECRAVVNLIPQKPADNPAVTTGPQGWDRVYAGAAAETAAFETANPLERSRAWKGLRDDARVTALDYGRFWRLVMLFPAVSTVLIAVAFRLDPPARPEAEASH